MAELVGYIFGYGSLVSSEDALVLQSTTSTPSIHGVLEGHQRAWRVAMDNTAARNDHAYYVDEGTGMRADCYVVALGLEHGEAAVNGVAVPVTSEALPQFDHRELHYERVDVSEAFQPALDLPVWTYVADATAQADYAAGLASGNAFVPRFYHRSVLEAFADLGSKALADFHASTTPPEVPLADLVRPPNWGEANEDG
jgi:hypothetical protein